MKRSMVPRLLLGGLAGLLCLGVFVGPQSAQAMCASPRIGFSHEDGATLPEDPSVYVFIPGELRHRIEVLAGDEVLEREVVEVSRSDALAAYRVSFETAGHTEVQLQLRGSGDDPLTYTIDPAWRAPAPRSSEGVIKTKSSRYRWQCSYEKARQLLLADDAPAYRVEIADSRAAYDRGERGRWVVPHDMGRLWRSYAEPEVPSPAADPVIELGHLNCMGWSVPKQLYEGCMVVGVVALHPDGSEQLLTIEPEMIGCTRAERRSSSD